VHQHLVHHHLEEQRADQGEQLQQEADQQHLAQQLAVFDQAGDEPGEVKLGQFTGQAGAAGDQDQLAHLIRSLPGAARCLPDKLACSQGNTLAYCYIFDIHLFFENSENSNLAAFCFRLSLARCTGGWRTSCGQIALPAAVPTSASFQARSVGTPPPAPWDALWVRPKGPTVRPQ
jgi:hypothetical protein